MSRPLKSSPPAKTIRRASRSRPNPESAPSHISAGQIAAVLEGYASRGVFRGFSTGSRVGDRTTFKLLWHRDRLFDLVYDARRSTLRFPAVLPQVDAAMLKDLRSFVASRQESGLPEHRRIDPARIELTCSVRKREASLSVAFAAGDYEYAVKKLIGLVHEIYLVFLYEPRYYDYLIETFDLDPDHL